MAPPASSRSAPPRRQKRKLRRIKRHNNNNAVNKILIMIMNPRTIVVGVVVLATLGYVLFAGYFVYQQQQQSQQQPQGGTDGKGSSSSSSSHNLNQQHEPPGGSSVSNQDKGGGLRKSAAAAGLTQHGLTQQQQEGVSSSASAPDSCAFRNYPSHRFYHLPGPQYPDFLLESEYIYGQWPSLLRSTTTTASDNNNQPQATKLCVDQSSWRSNVVNQTTTTQPQHKKDSSSSISSLLPFADGTNPSIVSVERYRQQVLSKIQSSSSGNNNHTDDSSILQKDPLLRAIDAISSSIQTQQLNDDKNRNNQQQSTVIHYIATVCMTNSQCHWRDSPADAQRLGINTAQTQPDTVRTVLLFLNEHGQSLHQTTIYLKRNARFGTSKRHGMEAVKEESGVDKNNGPAAQSNPQLHLLALDDARLFVHQQQLWVSYREGKLFGYDAQVLNPIHFDIVPPPPEQEHQHITATLWASETTSFCCGRNMALMEQEPLEETSLHPPSALLESVTWVDPVTVVAVDTTPHALLAADSSGQRRLQQQQEEEEEEESREPALWGSFQISKNAATSLAYPGRTSHIHSNATIPKTSLSILPQSSHDGRRRLGQIGKKKKNAAKTAPRQSHIHGTNAFMVYLPDRREYLGVAHFHRPDNRKRNPYARFGHHYTHAFYTIRANDNTTTTSSNEDEVSSFHLSALSREFVLPVAASSAIDDGSNDAEVIQFISGLELVQPQDGTKPYLMLAYGINDCEAALVRVDYKEVMTEWLKPVVANDKTNPIQVVDLMKPLDRQSISQKQKVQ